METYVPEYLFKWYIDEFKKYGWVHTAEGKGFSIYYKDRKFMKIILDRKM